MKSAWKKWSSVLALALSATAAGCASDSPEPGDGDGGGGGGGDGEEAERPVDAVGRYKLQSKLDLAASAPGTVGDAIRMFIEITDDPEDPTLWVVDQAIAAMPSGYVKTAFKYAKPYVVGYLNDRVLDLAPEFVGIAVQLGDDLGQMAQNFGLNETLEVAGAPGAYTAKHTVIGTHFKIDNIESDHAFADHGAADVVTDAVGATLDDAGRLGLAEHRVPLSYGEILRIGVDAAIVPMFEPSARNLRELFAAKVNCPLIGIAIEAVVGVGSPSTYADACTDGLNAGADYIYGKLGQIDGTALEFGLAGSAKALDKNGDGAIDLIVTGTWTGTVSYGSASAPLATATFFGERL